jgi:arsenate reductase
MMELGIDMSKHRSKNIEEFRGRDIDLVVSVNESSVRVLCPFCSSLRVGDRPKILDETVPEATRYLHRPFRDPSEVEGSDEEKLAAFRRTRDEIKQWILDYFANLKLESSNY